MHKVLILGGGKIGSLMAAMLASYDDYEVTVADAAGDASEAHGVSGVAVEALDATDQKALAALIRERKVDAVLSSLPYFCNPPVAEVARETGIHYFDLTEDVEVTRKVAATAKGADRAFVPQCGLAPGFISIAANDLMQHFDEIDTVKMRVGALPQHPGATALNYSLTWSTDGVINEYGNTCYGIVDGELIAMAPLESYERINIDGVEYEAFNTSGGLGSLADTWKGRVRNMTYKTMRYPGHRDLVRFLMNDLQLNEDRGTLKRILENAVPRTKQDVVLVYVIVIGNRKGSLRQDSFWRKVYPSEIGGRTWTAIQITTSSGICGVLDMVLSDPERYHGLINQEQFDLHHFLGNRFGHYYATD